MATDAMFRDETSKTCQRAAQSEVTPPQYSHVPLGAPFSNAGSTPRSEHYDSFQTNLYASSAGSISDERSTDDQEYAAWFSRAPGSLRPLDAALAEQQALVSFAPSPAPWLLKAGDIMVQYFFEQIVMPNTWLDGLPQLYSRGRGTAALHYAIDAASRFLMVNQTGDYLMAEAAHRSYSRCLKLLNAALGNAAEKSKDQTICTVLILHLMNV